jgi:hypothetical protein
MVSFVLIGRVGVTMKLIASFDMMMSMPFLLSIDKMHKRFIKKGTTPSE